MLRASKMLRATGHALMVTESRKASLALGVWARAARAKGSDLVRARLVRIFTDYKIERDYSLRNSMVSVYRLI